MSQYKIIFSNVYTPNWSEERFVIKKVRNSISWTYAFSNFDGEKIDGTFFKEWNNKKCWKLIRNAEKSKFTYNDWGIAFNGKVFCIFWC